MMRIISFLNVILCLLYAFYHNRIINKKIRKMPLKVKIGIFGDIFINIKIVCNMSNKRRVHFQVSQQMQSCQHSDDSKTITVGYYINFWRLKAKILLSLTTLLSYYETWVHLRKSVNQDALWKGWCFCGLHFETILCFVGYFVGCLLLFLLSLVGQLKYKQLVSLYTFDITSGFQVN